MKELMRFNINGVTYEEEIDHRRTFQGQEGWACAESLVYGLQNADVNGYPSEKQTYICGKR